jgi:hypothetical protein
MNAQQYLLSQAEFCRRRASQSADPYLAEELSRLAQQFEMSARRGRSSLSAAELERHAVRRIEQAHAPGYTISS